ncbi:MAG TPA: 50S ribosomal protein L15e [Candidatus Nanoarchaeia archaeon]|nr:50S ribosomal protein L15e [Candidatus Nanoarchaeia archaeon]
MAQSMYHYMGEAWKQPDKEVMKTRLVQWRAGNSFTVVDKPLRIDKARALGYKAKKGFVVVRVRLLRGGRQRSRHTHGRKSRKQHVRKILKMNYRWVAEQRAEKRFGNLVVLNSYPIGKDGKNNFFEVIMVDPHKPEIMNDKDINWICVPGNQKRAIRGLTSAAKKSRGMRSKSHSMKVRPSLRSWDRRGK